MAARYSGRDRDIAESGRSKAQQSTTRFESTTSDRNPRDSSVSYDRNSSRPNGPYLDYDDGGYGRNWRGGRNNSRRGYGSNEPSRGSNHRRGGHNAQNHHWRGGYAPDDVSDIRSDYSRRTNKSSRYGSPSRPRSRSRSRSPVPPRRRDFLPSSPQRDERRNRETSPVPPRKRDFQQSSPQRDEKRNRETSPVPPRKRDFRQSSSQRDEQSNRASSARSALNNTTLPARSSNGKRDRSYEQEQNIDRESKRTRVAGPPASIARDAATRDFEKDRSYVFFNPFLCSLQRLTVMIALWNQNLWVGPLAPAMKTLPRSSTAQTTLPSSKHRNWTMMRALHWHASGVKRGKSGWQQCLVTVTHSSSCYCRNDV